MIKRVKFADHVDTITAMMTDMLHLEPVKVNIPVPRYIELCEADILHSYLWYEGSTVKGVALIMVSPSLRNGAIINAGTDVIWVKPEHRGNSKFFIKAIAYRLKHAGVNYWYVSSRHNAPIDSFWRANDFTPLEQLFYKEL